MNRIRIVSVGKIKEKYWAQAQEEYVKRLSRFARVEIVEVKDEATPENATDAEKNAVLRKEAERVRKAWDGFDMRLVLAVEAKEEDSLAFADRIGKLMDAGKSLCFIIGGSFGLAEEIKKEAEGIFSLSKLTFPHRLARIILLEQIYRACKIYHHEDYHK